MFIFGFPICPDDAHWCEDPFSEDEEFTPEAKISEACHVYKTREGQRYIGFEIKLGLNEEDMRNMLVRYSSDLDIRKVV